LKNLIEWQASKGYDDDAFETALLLHGEIEALQAALPFVKGPEHREKIKKAGFSCLKSFILDLGDSEWPKFLSFALPLLPRQGYGTPCIPDERYIEFAANELEPPRSVNLAKTRLVRLLKQRKLFDCDLTISAKDMIEYCRRDFHSHVSRMLPDGLNVYRGKVECDSVKACLQKLAIDPVRAVVALAAAKLNPLTPPSRCSTSHKSEKKLLFVPRMRQRYLKQAGDVACPQRGALGRTAPGDSGFGIALQKRRRARLHPEKEWFVAERTRTWHVLPNEDLAIYCATVAVDKVGSGTSVCVKTGANVPDGAARSPETTADAVMSSPGTPGGIAADVVSSGAERLSRATADVTMSSTNGAVIKADVVASNGGGGQAPARSKKEEE